MGYGLLEGKKGIIFGALDENSIAWHVALQVFEEGGRFVLSNHDIALRKGDIYRLAEQTQSIIIAADVTSLDDIENLFDETLKYFGTGLDFILHAVGMSPNVRKNIPYPELNYEYFMKTIDISALSLHKILSVAYKKDALQEYASVVTLSYLGAQRHFSSYSDMSQAKAMLESIVRSFGYHYGIKKKVRINSVSQSPTKTTAGKGVKGFDAFYSLSNCMSPIGNATAEDCAKFCVLLFSDYARKITMQNIFHDGGFSSMGISDRLMSKCFSCIDYCEENNH
ncbi:MAG: SDR family oxidoreductase [Bacteroidales bacterium]|nr:SDR family oxidoreductase [Bacteroidales bacterium]